jgi:Ca2+-binding EF-hand superfamily protein
MPPPPPGGSSESSSLSEVFSTLDTNQDGTVSADELMALFQDSEETSSSSTSSSSNAASTSASSTATSSISTSSTSASETDTIAKQLSQNLLKQILSSYGSNGSGSSDAQSLLSLSA